LRLRAAVRICAVLGWLHSPPKSGIAEAGARPATASPAVMT
jgi:hypothetical protein